MQTGERRNFDAEAAQWDANPGRVKLAAGVAEAIIREVRPAKEMDALDFGCGTGLVTLRLQPLVRTITGVDSSAGMLGVLEEKVRSQGLANVRTRLLDFEKGERIDEQFHLVVSSMTMHHVPDTTALFGQWYDLLRPGGIVAAADLDAEDGSFHGDNTGVFHKGFERKRVAELLRGAGFRDVRDTTAAVMTREAPGGGTREFPVFLVTGRK